MNNGPAVPSPQQLVTTVKPADRPTDSSNLNHERNARKCTMDDSGVQPNHFVVFVKLMRRTDFTFKNLSIFSILSSIFRLYRRSLGSPPRYPKTGSTRVSSSRANRWSLRTASFASESTSANPLLCPGNPAFATARICDGLRFLGHCIPTYFVGL